MKTYLQHFFDVFEYPADARAALLSAYDVLISDKRTADGFFELLSRYEADINCNFRQLLADMENLCKLASIHEYTGKLLLCVCMSRRLREYYRSAGLSDELWHAAMNDLRYKLIECRLVYGIWGSFVCAWFNRFFNMTRFALGRLQFETVRFGRSYSKNGITLSADSLVINVHIPRTGGRLYPEQVKASYSQAAAFFKERYLLDSIVFVCDSWLLYPKNLEILSENSNLRRFIMLFDLYGHGTYDNYNSLWRLFDKNYTGDVDALPQDSSFRRGYAEWVRKGIPTGWGCGVYVYQE